MPGFLKGDVTSDLARLLKTDEHKASSLLCGRETLIKRNATPGDVERYMQALHKVGAAARSVQANAPSAFPTLNEDVIVPPSEQVTPVPKLKPAPQPQPHPPQELTLAPGWAKPGEEPEPAAASAARGEHAASAGFSTTASSSSASRPGTMQAARGYVRTCAGLCRSSGFRFVDAGKNWPAALHGLFLAHDGADAGFGDPGGHACSCDGVCKAWHWHGCPGNSVRYSPALGVLALLGLALARFEQKREVGAFAGFYVRSGRHFGISKHDPDGVGDILDPADAF